MDYDIYPVERYEDYKACERLQSDVFGYADIDVVPYQLLRSFATSGGAVIGAFDGGSLIGFVVGYTGLLDDGTPYHRSQRLAVLPGYRGQGVGETLKHAQADLARQRGLRLMCWTFDPLRSINAHLNIHKLGAISRRYMANAYAASSNPMRNRCALFASTASFHPFRRRNTSVAKNAPRLWARHDAVTFEFTALVER